MNDKNFKAYLHRIFEQENPKVLDDEMVDSFEKWLQGVDVLSLADDYATERLKKANTINQ